MVLSITACEYVGESPTTPRLEPPTPVESTSISTTDTAHVEPAPQKPKPAPKPAASQAVVPGKVIDQKPEPVYEGRRMMTRAGPKWVRPATRGGPQWKPTVEEKPRVTREPIDARTRTSVQPSTTRKV